MSDVVAPPPRRRGMSRAMARTIEYAIVAASIVALGLIFQPFSLQLFSIGAGFIIFVGLVFNLVPLAQPGKTLLGLLKGAMVVALAFAVLTLLSLAAAVLYGMYVAVPPQQ